MTDPGLGPLRVTLGHLHLLLRLISPVLREQPINSDSWENDGNHLFFFFLHSYYALFMFQDPKGLSNVDLLPAVQAWTHGCWELEGPHPYSQAPGKSTESPLPPGWRGLTSESQTVARRL